MLYTHDTAPTEASRCLLCHDEPCHGGCPASVNPKKFIRRIRFGDLAGAARLLRDANILAGSCAYICPCLGTCCAKCTSEKLGRPIDIAGLQRFVTDWERVNAVGARHAVPIQPNTKKIAIIGSGPAGLACAAKLATQGYAVEIFEQSNAAGGQLRLSIPSFRLPTEVLDYEIELIKNLGVTFHFNTKVTDIILTSNKQFNLSLINNYCHPERSEGSPNANCLTEILHSVQDDKSRDASNIGSILTFDAVFAAPGLMASKKLGIPGEDKKGVFDALDFLTRSKAGEKINLGKRVLVIGGGDTAIDAAFVAKKMGADVILLYRRTQNDMPAYRPEVDEAFSKGIELWFRIVPVSVLGKEKVEGLQVNRVKWKGIGRSAKTFEIDGPEFEIKADTIINAVGQTISLPLSGGGWPEAGRGGERQARGIFSGGDFKSGGATAVAAIGDGMCAADEIDAYCHGSVGAQHAVPKIERARHAVPLQIQFCGINFENPFILAAAPPTDELEMLRNGLKAGWAGAVLKTTSMEGTPVPLKYPMMSSMEHEGSRVSALGNIDLISEHHIDVIEDRIRKLKKEFPTKRIIGSIMGSKKEDWQTLVKRLSDAGADMIECSFSCPQGSLGAKPGQMLAQDVALTKTVAGWVKEAAKAHPRNLPVVIKITPHVTDIIDVANAVKEAGCDAVCASNTIQSLMGIDLDSWIPNPNVAGKSTYSGMSGPAVKPITLKVISEIARRSGIAISGTGGPVTWSDAVEFMLCGATTVQFCTAVMHYGYDIIDDLKEGVSEYLRQKNLTNVSQLIGRALPHICSHEELPYHQKIISKIDHTKCICDDLCHIACRDGGHMAISMDADRKPIVDKEKCVGCGLCRLVCPVSGCVEIVRK